MLTDFPIYQQYQKSRCFCGILWLVFKTYLQPISFGTIPLSPHLAWKLTEFQSDGALQKPRFGRKK